MYDDGSALKANLASVEAQVLTTQAEINRIKPIVASADQIKKEHDEYERDLNTVLKFFPPQFDPKDLRELLTTEASLLGMDIRNVNAVASFIPSNQLAQGLENFSKEFPIVTGSISIKGTFDTIMLYLTNLSKRELMIVVKSLNFGGSSQRGRSDGPLMLDVGVDVVVYTHLNPSGAKNAEATR